MDVDWLVAGGQGDAVIGGSDDWHVPVDLGFRCTFPNCASKLGLDCHHVVAWPEGPTEPDNLTLLCRTHHRLVHELGWHVTMAPDQTTSWFRPDWTPYVPRPPSSLPAGIDPAEERPRRWGLSPTPRLGHAAAF